MADRLEAIEAKLAFLEDTNDTLSDQIAAQFRMIEGLSSRLAVALERLGELEAGGAGSAGDEEPPPHY